MSMFNRKKLAMKLIEEWRHAWKMFSVQANVIAISLIGAYQALPDDFKHAIPSNWMMGAAAALVAIGTVGRLVDQGIKKNSEETKKEE